MANPRLGGELAGRVTRYPNPYAPVELLPYPDSNAHVIWRRTIPDAGDLLSYYSNMGVPMPAMPVAPAPAPKRRGSGTGSKGSAGSTAGSAGQPGKTQQGAKTEEKQEGNKPEEKKEAPKSPSGQRTDGSDLFYSDSLDLPADESFTVFTPGQSPRDADAWKSDITKYSDDVPADATVPPGLRDVDGIKLKRLDVRDGTEMSLSPNLQENVDAIRGAIDSFSNGFKSVIDWFNDSPALVPLEELPNASTLSEASKSGQKPAEKPAESKTLTEASNGGKQPAAPAPTAPEPVTPAPAPAAAAPVPSASALAEASKGNVASELSLKDAKPGDVVVRGGVPVQVVKEFPTKQSATAPASQDAQLEKALREKTQRWAKGDLTSEEFARAEKAVQEHVRKVSQSTVGALGIERATAEYLQRNQFALTDPSTIKPSQFLRYHLARAERAMSSSVQPYIDGYLRALRFRADKAASAPKPSAATTPSRIKKPAEAKPAPAKTQSTPAPKQERPKPAPKQNSQKQKPLTYREFLKRERERYSWG